MLRSTNRIGAVVLIGLAGWSLAGEKTVVADRELAAWVDKRVAERQPSAEDKRFDEIGWAKDIRTAERLAKEHGRPVFLFTHDGHMNVGRC